jgi:DNA-binding NarL/FixJ family response regulator
MPRDRSLTEPTPKEWEIIRLIAQGLSNKSIAQRLCVSEPDIDYHLGNLYRKFGVSNRTQLIVRVLLNGTIA